MKKIIPLLYMSFCLFSCNDEKYNKYSDEFYRLKKNREYKIIPLSKPYIIENMSNFWFTKFFEFPSNCNLVLSDVKYFYVYENYIFFKYDGSKSNCKPSPEFYYYVINPQKEINEEYTEIEKLNSFIKENNITKFEWYEPNKVYEDYETTGILPWVKR